MNVAIYLRSSKDRASVSIDAQRRELAALAESRGWTITVEYADAVESGKTEFRPGFQALLRAMKEPEHKRGWATLLVTDTSRLSRRRYVAQIFKHEAKKQAIDIVYAKVPETDPITTVILQAVFEAMDEVHSLISREKGLAGMAENVKQGYRAGGRAPRGYRLKTLEIGASREGVPVTKTVLEPNEEAPAVARYLKAKARGAARNVAMQEAGANWSPGGLIGMEWNALCYAGHTVWNRHAGEGKKTRFRPPDEWVIQRDTHPALIADREAEAILHQLRTSTIGQAVSLAKQGLSHYLLTGFLYAPDGRSWEGWRDKRYRVKPDATTQAKGRYVNLDELEKAVKGQIVADLQSRDLIRDLVAASRPPEPSAENAERDAEIAEIEKRISRAMDLAVSVADPAIAVRKINELEAQRKVLVAERERDERDRLHATVIDTMDEKKVTALLADIAGDLHQLSPERWRSLLSALVSRIELDPASLKERTDARRPRWS